MIIVDSMLLFSGNEARNARLRDGIESDPGRDSLIDFLHGVFRKRGDLEVLLDPCGRPGRRQKCRPALDGPREYDLSRSFADPSGDRCNDRIHQDVGLAIMT